MMKNDFDAALEKALTIIKEFEGCRLTAYRCPAGLWTIGYGQTVGVKPGMVWTQDQVEADLVKSVRTRMELVLQGCPNLSTEPPGRLAACTSLAYNIGVAAFWESSVCRLTKANRFMEAAEAFLLWNKSRSKVLPGLVRRRQAERALYLERQ